MEDFKEFKDKVLSLLTKEIINGNYDTLKNTKKEIIALTENTNYTEFSNGSITNLEFYDDEDVFLDYVISFYKSNEHNYKYLSINVMDKKKGVEVGFLK